MRLSLPLYSPFIRRSAITLLIISLALAVVSFLLILLDLPAPRIAQALLNGSLSSWLKFSYALSIWIPLLLCASGLLFTFRAGLWNIGIEGQVIWGAIGATLLLRQDAFGLAPGLLISLALLAGFVSGGAWGVLAGVLKSRGGVNEIFGGLGLNFVAQGFILWLILGPWKRAGIASMSGTDLFARELWLRNPPGWQVAPSALLLALSCYLITCLILGKTKFGLQIRACGNNPQAATLFGIAPQRTWLSAMFLGGGLAGIAGGLQVSCVYHRLLPSISSGYGYLALLVVMLANYRVLPVPFIALCFACLAAGSIQLPIVLQIDSSLSGVIQGACVVSALFIHGMQKHYGRKH